MIIYVELGTVVTILTILFVMVLSSKEGYGNFIEELMESIYGEKPKYSWDELNMEKYIPIVMIILSPICVLLWPILILINIYTIMKYFWKES